MTVCSAERQTWSTEWDGCFRCEETATDFDVQGLKFDWAGVGWEAALRYQCPNWPSWYLNSTDGR